MADRFYCPDSPVDGKLALEGDEARHLARVRRVAVGEVVELFDGQGRAYRAEVVGLGKDRVDLRVVERVVSASGPKLALTLATAVPKGDRFDWLIEKATELGVDRLVPLVTERSVVDPRSAKLDRLRRAVVEACKQCRRDTLMAIDGPARLDDLIRSPRHARRLFAHPGGRAVASLTVDRDAPTLLAIGPEGGFTDAEVERAEGGGWIKISLGPTVLRVETAGLAGAAVLLALGEV